jgi:hypothetical protein
MNNKLKEKKFDAVKMMREIRDRLSEKYFRHPELEDQDLEAVRKKYSIRPQEKPGKYKNLS